MEGRGHDGRDPEEQTPRADARRAARSAAARRAAARHAPLAQGPDRSRRRLGARGRRRARLRAADPRTSRRPAQELLSTQNRPSAEGLAGLPKDYTGLPRQAPPLGPPLPGDLGKPILNAGAAPNTDRFGDHARNRGAARRPGDRSGARQPPVRADQPAAAAGQRSSLRRRRRRRAVRRRRRPSMPAPRRTCRIARRRSSTPRPTSERSAPTGSKTKASPYIVQAGTVIPAALITGIRSDLPGQITAQVTEAVYDSPTGQYLLIPQGAKLIGQYDSSVAFGQSRILLVWTRLIMPDGTSIVLERQPGADTRRLCRPRGRGRQPLGQAVRGRRSLDPAQRRRGSRHEPEREQSRPGDPLAAHRTRSARRGSRSSSASSTSSRP